MVEIKTFNRFSMRAGAEVLVPAESPAQIKPLKNMGFFIFWVFRVNICPMAGSSKVFRAYPRLRVAGLFAGTLCFRAAGVKTQNFASPPKHRAAPIPGAKVVSNHPSDLCSGARTRQSDAELLSLMSEPASVKSSFIHTFGTASETKKLFS